MPRPPTAPSVDDASGSGALLESLRTLLAPMARLAVAHGLPFSAAEEALKQAFVEASRQALRQAGLPEHRLVSRISTSTGINRREVTRLTGAEAVEARAAPSGSLATQVFTRWVTDRRLRTRQGGPKPLPRLGPAPSFDVLARSVTQDVHPRSVLDELCRLGLAEIDPDTDMVRLLRHAFVPGADKQHMLAFLADNTGDHLQGAVHNVVAGGVGRQHFDQAVFADELSRESLDEVRAFVSRQWKQLLDEAVPLLEALIAADQRAGRPQDHRVRIGLYSFDCRVGADGEAGTTDTEPNTRKREPRS